MAMDSLKTGKISRCSQNQILTPLFNKILSYSQDRNYCDKDIRRDAAHALVTKFPALKQKRTHQETVKSYITSLVEKGKNVNRKTKKLGLKSPRQMKELEKIKQRAKPAQAVLSDTRRVTSFEVTLTEKEGQDMEDEKQELKAELRKSKVEQNSRKVQRLMERTFSLRRQEIIDNSFPAADALRHWPALKQVSCALQDLAIITSVGVAELTERIGKFSDLAKRIVDYSKKMSSLPSSHPAVKLLHSFQSVEEPNDDALHALAIALLPYLIPTTTRKPFPNVSRFMIDFYPCSATMADVMEDVDGRNQPVIIISGSFDDIQKIHVIADGQVVAKVKSMKDAIVTMTAMHYILNVKYNAHVKLSHFFIERFVCGVKCIKEEYKSVIAFNTKLY